MELYQLLVAVVVILLFLHRQYCRRYPPGPTPLPLLGNTLQFLIGKWQGKSNVDLTIEWKKRFGNVYTVWLGPMPVVFICDYQTTIDAFVKNSDAHAGRQNSFAMRKVRGGNKGVLFSDGPEWQEQKRFTLHTLRNFGLGRNLMQQRIMEEVDYRFELLDRDIADSKDGSFVMNPAPFLELLIGSIINKLTAGYRYDETNKEEFFRLKRSFNAVLEVFTPLDFMIFSEQTYQLPLFRQRWKKAVQPNYEILEVLERLIRERKKEIESGQRDLSSPDQAEDYIDAYFIEMKKRERNGEPQDSFSESCLRANLLDLWIAGTDTTIGSMLWGFIYLVRDQEIQEKVRAEVLSVTGGNRPVELSDKAYMIYTNAVVTEILRISCLLNVNLFHRTTCDTVVGEYLLPAGVALTAQLSAILNDESVFEDPQKFNPDRFLNNKKLEQQVIPFSVGKRACLGESLARAEMFMILSNFLARYRISVPDGCDPPSTEQVALDSVLKRSRLFEVKVTKVL